ncbi:hypothetical protein QVD17_40168 [Tagetes erecta]|uniref:Uncharacterized protein n=1 Tax=Tagetes erecta TaxID=13708 RepID=A0AAD8JVP5_TARER|nr:hypothetical protein QVD17_40168 [Tagetes erecta]
MLEIARNHHKSCEHNCIQHLSISTCIHLLNAIVSSDMSNNYPRNQISYNLPPNLQTFYKMFHTTLI